MLKKWSNAQMVNSQTPNAQMPKCPNAQMLKCPNAQMLKCPNAQMVKCSNPQMLKSSNAQKPAKPVFKIRQLVEQQHFGGGFVVAQPFAKLHRRGGLNSLLLDNRTIPRQGHTSADAPRRSPFLGNLDHIVRGSRQSDVTIRTRICITFCATFGIRFLRIRWAHPRLDGPKVRNNWACREEKRASAARGGGNYGRAEARAGRLHYVAELQKQTAGIGLYKFQISSKCKRMDA